MKIQNSVPSVDRTCLSIDRKNEEIHHKATALFDWFSIPVQSILNNIWSIKRNSRSNETMKNFIIEFLSKSIGSQFLFDQSKGKFDWSKLTKLNFSEFSSNRFSQFLLFSIKNTFWFYEWRFTDQTSGFSRS